MTKTKILNFLLILICMFSLTSCGKKVDKFDEFKEAVNKQYDSITYDMAFEIEMKMGSMKESESSSITVKMEGNKTYIEGTMFGEEGKAYAELEGDKYRTWEYDDGKWESSEAITKEQYESMVSYPTIEVEEGDFEYKDGVWVANTEKIKEKLAKATSGILGELSGSYTIDVSKYNIKFNKDKIEKIEMVFSMKMSVSGYSMEYNFTYDITFSDHDKTKVERPSGVQ